MNAFLAVCSAALLGQVASEPAAAGAASVQVESVWDFMIKGGPMMIPIGLCSLVALAVIIERAVSLRRSGIIPPRFFPGLKKVLGNGVDDREEVLDYCREHDSPIARVFSAGIKKLGLPVELVEKHIEDAGQREVVQLRKNLRVLSVIASIAPLMGLLGTIFGMIIAFQTVASSAEALGKAELLAKGIYQAMITTAAGLMVAIPVLVAYHWISAKVDRLVADMDQLTVEFVEQYVPIGDDQRRVGTAHHSMRRQSSLESPTQSNDGSEKEKAASERRVGTAQQSLT